MSSVEQIPVNDCLRQRTYAQPDDLPSMSADFSGLYSRNLSGLRLLALLLTADHDKAEKCFVPGLQDCGNGNPVFRDWAHSWARSAIIKNALHLVAPHPDLAHRASVQMALDGEVYATPEQGRAAAKVLALGDFERLVFLISLEGYRDQECALLLHCSPHDIHRARTRALHQLAEDEGTDAVPENETTLHSHRHSLQVVVS
jgi:hypothetical protein